MRKSLVKVILTIFVGALLVGCSKNTNNKFDVDEYLSENGFKKCVVEGDPEEIEDCGVTYWNVYDEENDIHFWVIKSLTPNLFTPDVDFYDNYDVRLTEKHLNELPEHEGLELQNGEMPYLYAEHPVVCISYTDFDDLEKKYDKLLDCAEYLTDFKGDISFKVISHYNSERMQYYSEKSVYNCCERANVDYLAAETYSELTDRGMLASIKEKCINFAYGYRFPEIESEMTQDEKDKFWNRSVVNCVAVYRSGEADESNTDFDVYEDIYYESGIYIGNLYYLLIAEGFDVDGAVDDFTVHTIDGRLCQFSYDYADSEKANDSYYIIDGTPIDCDASFFMLRSSTVKDLFGLTIGEYSKDK